MNEEVELILEDAEERMQKVIEHLTHELLKIRAGRASTTMVEEVKVEYYGTETPLNQVANVSTPDGTSIRIQPWERNLIGTIEKAILAANLGFNPSNNGEAVIINVPALTEERRRELVKQVKNESEQAKVSIRAVRRDVNDALKKLKKEGLSEDEEKSAEDDVQKLTDKYILESDRVIDKKEKDIMTV